MMTGIQCAYEKGGWADDELIAAIHNGIGIKR